jgi:hypothetical protein
VIVNEVENRLTGAITALRITPVKQFKVALDVKLLTMPLILSALHCVVTAQVKLLAVPLILSALHEIVAVVCILTLASAV